MSREISPKLFWQLFLPVFGIAIFGLIVLFIGVYSAISKHSLNSTTIQLKNDSKFIGKSLETATKLSDTYPILRQFSQATLIRVSITDHSGIVIFDSAIDPKKLDNHMNRPEIKEALNSGFGSNIRHSDTINQKFLYYASTFEHDKNTYILRLSHHIWSIKHGTQKLIQDISVLVLLILILSLIFTIYISKRITDPISALVAIANEYAQENFIDINIPSKFKEIRDLKSAMKKMSLLLQKRINDIYEESEEKKHILDNMISGIMVLNDNGSIHTLNPAAAKLLNITPETQSYQEAIPHEEIKALIQHFYTQDTLSETEVMVKQNQQKKYLLLTGSKNNHQMILIIQDITQIKNLERTRQDFVANVSHELKTPITLIFGAAETIEKDGSIDSKMKPFLDMILTHSQRMNTIIDDLLQLSQLESLNTLQKKFVKIEVSRILGDSLSNCQEKIRIKEIQIINQIPQEPYFIMGHYALLSQAISNLLLNAVKYSPEKSTITITQSVKGPELWLSIQDEGLGISEKDQKKIFERFFRVDRGRSRKMGGTGLGLSIVKHILQAHNGQVHVSSKLDQGSCFSLILPLVSSEDLKI